MDHQLPLVTIIVPTKPGQAVIKSVEAARGLDYPKERMELIVARGKQPSIQRNQALRQARGEIIYFLDDDSQPVPGALRQAVAHFENPAVQMVGGPNLCPPDAPFLEQIFAVVLASVIAFGPSRARYDQVGKVRVSGEKELILCNLLARRAPVLELGGFDEALYPNEENALMDELQKRGGQLIHDPEVLAYRRPRPTLKAFCRMLLNYGRGRAEQFRLHPTPGSFLNFVPPLFVLYLALIPLWAWLGWFNHSSVVRINGEDAQAVVQSVTHRYGLAWFPLAGYAVALLGQTALNLGKGPIRALAALPLLFATHLFYGLGFWRGLFSKVTKTRPAATGVELEHLPL